MDITIATILESTGLGVFMYYLFRGLTMKINSIESVVKAQKATIDIMDKRIEETEKIGNIYKNLISDLPADIDNYKTIISKTKDETIVELKNQNEISKKKLDEAQRIIESSGNSKEIINSHLRTLKSLMSKPPKNQHGISKDYDIREISEFAGRSIEHSVTLIVESPTVEVFLEKNGFQVNITEDDEIAKTFFIERKTPSGESIEIAMVSHSIDGGWFAVANNKIWVNSIRLNQWKDEFSAIKTIS